MAAHPTGLSAANNMPRGQGDERGQIDGIERAKKEGLILTRSERNWLCMVCEPHQPPGASPRFLMMCQYQPGASHPEGTRRLIMLAKRLRRKSAVGRLLSRWAID